MTTTFSTDLYSPEVWADLAAAALKGRSALLGLAVTNDTLEGQPGDTIVFPSWLMLGDLEDLEETDVLVPEELGQKNSQVKIKEAGKAVEFTDRAKLVGVGNIQDEAIRQFGILAAKKLDLSLITAAQTEIAGGTTFADGTPAVASAPLKAWGGVGSKLGYKTFSRALVKFGDEIDSADFAAAVVHSTDYADLLEDDDFIKAAQANGSNSVVNGRIVGTLAGVPILVSDRVTVGTVLIIKKGALGVFYKRRPIVERDRDILKRTTVIATNVHFATKRVIDEGVLVFKLNEAEPAAA